MGFCWSVAFQYFGPQTLALVVFLMNLCFSPLWPRAGESSLDAGAKQFQEGREKVIVARFVLLFSFVLCFSAEFAFCCILLHLTMWTETQRAARSRFKSQFLSSRFSPILSFSFGLNLCLSPNYPCAESSEILHLVYSKQIPSAIICHRRLCFQIDRACACYCCYKPPLIIAFLLHKDVRFANSSLYHPNLT